MEITREFRIEERTGCIWAVELRGHEPIGACGPLLLDDVDDDLLDDYEYTGGALRWLEANAEHFARFVPTLPEIPPT